MSPYLDSYPTSRWTMIPVTFLQVPSNSDVSVSGMQAQVSRTGIRPNAVHNLPCTALLYIYYLDTVTFFSETIFGA